MKLSVLFVDDDNNIIGGLKRMMHKMQSEWNLLYANGGKEAIDVLQNNEVDVIISDIRMPGIDGTQLLAYVKDNFPKIVRITLSGYANDNMALRNTRIVHQSLSKPTTPENVKYSIEKACRLRQKLNNDSLLKTINNIDELPSLPEIYIELENEINMPNSSIDKLSKIISTDPVIAAKILQLTNSAFFGLPNRISNIKQALNFLGIKLIKNLVLTIKLFKALDFDNPKVDLFHKIWEHSNNVAFISKQIATIKKLSKIDIEDSYLGGLFHNIGKIILLENSAEINELNLYDENNPNIDLHAEIGAYLLGIWGLPDSIVESVAFHHTPEIFTIEYEKLSPAQVVYLANTFSKNPLLTPLEIDETKINELVFELSNPNSQME